MPSGDADISSQKWKRRTMNTPVWTKPAIWGAVAGCAATAIVGFGYMGWSTAASTERLAVERANTAVVAALVPLCIANAKADEDLSRMVKFKAESSSYSRSDLVRTSGWASVPGMTAPSSSLVDACSEQLRSTSES